MQEKDDKNYYVVEFRFPVAVNAVSPEDAALTAGKLIEKELGFFPSAWYARVFEYGDIERGIGIIAEYFANPSGTTFRKVDQNIGQHEEIIQKSKETGG